jgi:predicted PurR-regulated permease PerM
MPLVISGRSGVSIVSSETPATRLVVWVVLAAGIAIVLLAMRAASEILSPILLGMLLAITASPLLNWFKKKGAPSCLCP